MLLKCNQGRKYDLLTNVKMILCLLGRIDRKIQIKLFQAPSSD